MAEAVVGEEACGSWNLAQYLGWWRRRAGHSPWWQCGSRNTWAHRVLSHSRVCWDHSRHCNETSGKVLEQEDDIQYAHTLPLSITPRSLHNHRTRFFYNYAALSEVPSDATPQTISEVRRVSTANGRRVWGADLSHWLHRTGSGRLYDLRYLGGRTRY